MTRRIRDQRGPRYAPAQRMDLLKSALINQRMTLEEMRRLLDVSMSTLQRMLRVLSTNEPLCEERIDCIKLWWIDASSARVSVRFTLLEIVSLRLARAALDGLTGTGIKEDLDEIVVRVDALLAKRELAIAHHLDKKLFVVPHAGRRLYEGRLDHVNDAMTGILKHERLSITHKPARGGQEQTFIFEPWTMLLYKTGLYLAGRREGRDKPTTLALDQCRAIEWRRGDAFEYPTGWHPSQLVDGAFGLIGGAAPVEVRVRFDAIVAPYVRRAKWHETQQIEELDGGALELAMRVRGTNELQSWVLSFGKHAEVLAPESLREKMRAELREAGARYG